MERCCIFVDSKKYQSQYQVGHHSIPSLNPTQITLSIPLSPPYLFSEIHLRLQVREQGLGFPTSMKAFSMGYKISLKTIKDVTQPLLPLSTHTENKGEKKTNTVETIKKYANLIKSKMPRVLSRIIEDRNKENSHNQEKNQAAKGKLVVSCLSPSLTSIFIQNFSPTSISGIRTLSSVINCIGNLLSMKLQQRILKKILAVLPQMTKLHLQKNRLLPFLL